ncbi:electron transfer flavoprotein subunit alpha/FixB family protein [Vibrio navarrensis]|uniref:electron transfer flavoprotein subunit alpha/FixB family protein n=1 Tax=Vibrio navarrensis TaxID=29495 RepID=UPI00186AB962|nr:FAD-binding protein [Vibrio navarrensis]MBE4599881.1 electron transfer flavoprotein subunit alpha [Vibrio navarrensis]
MNDKPVSTLVIAEHNQHTLASDTLRTLKAAQSLGGELSVLVMGHECEAVANTLRQCDGVTQVLLAQHSAYQHALAENGAELIAKLAADYSHILAPATTFGKNLLPRVAALLDVGQLSDVIAIESSDTVIRPVYAGNVLAKVQSLDAIKVMTIRSSAFDAIKVMTIRSSAFDAVSDCGGNAPVVEINQVIPSETSEFVRQEKTESKTESVRPELAAAKVVVSGGRGLGSKAQFALVEQLADKLGAAVGASRAAVDAGFVSNDLQVGQTGKIVAPQLYIAVGISGAIQHLAGMKDSKVIVAINSDADAPIFQVADYGLVGDLFTLVPELIEQL